MCGVTVMTMSRRSLVCLGALKNRPRNGSMPNTGMDGGHQRQPPGAHPATSDNWIQFDKERGTEKLWLV